MTADGLDMLSQACSICATVSAPCSVAEHEVLCMLMPQKATWAIQFASRAGGTCKVPVRVAGYRTGRYKKMRDEVKLQGRMLRSKSPVDHGLNEGNVLERMFSQHMSG